MYNFHTFKISSSSFSSSRSPTGNITVDLEVPHTITEWVSNGFCTSFYEGLGVSSTSYLKAFQPFFVSVTLPYSVIRGETVPVTANIFNYLEECLVVGSHFGIINLNTGFEIHFLATQKFSKYLIILLAKMKYPFVQFPDSHDANSCYRFGMVNCS